MLNTHHTTTRGLLQKPRRTPLVLLLNVSLFLLGSVPASGSLLPGNIFLNDSNTTHRNVNSFMQHDGHSLHDLHNGIDINTGSTANYCTPQSAGGKTADEVYVVHANNEEVTIRTFNKTGSGNYIYLTYLHVIPTTGLDIQTGNSTPVLYSPGFVVGSKMSSWSLHLEGVKTSTPFTDAQEGNTHYKEAYLFNPGDRQTILEESDTFVDTEKPIAEPCPAPNCAGSAIGETITVVPAFNASAIVPGQEYTFAVAFCDPVDGTTYRRGIRRIKFFVDGSEYISHTFSAYRRVDGTAIDKPNDASYTAKTEYYAESSQVAAGSSDDHNNPNKLRYKLVWTAPQSINDGLSDHFFVIQGWDDEFSHDPVAYGTNKTESPLHWLAETPLKTGGAIVDIAVGNVEQAAKYTLKVDRGWGGSFSTLGDITFGAEDGEFRARVIDLAWQSGQRSRYYLMLSMDNGEAQYFGPIAPVSESIDSSGPLRISVVPHGAEANICVRGGGLGIPEGAVFDVSGRRVQSSLLFRRMADGWLCTWGGNSENGRPVPSGMYFIKVAAGERRATVKYSLRR